jgi:hypothetical protein
VLIHDPRGFLMQKVLPAVLDRRMRRRRSALLTTRLRQRQP